MVFTLPPGRNPSDGRRQQRLFIGERSSLRFVNEAVVSGLVYEEKLELGWGEEFYGSRVRGGSTCGMG